MIELTNRKIIYGVFDEITGVPVVRKTFDMETHNSKKKTIAVPKKTTKTPKKIVLPRKLLNYLLFMNSRFCRMNENHNLTEFTYGFQDGIHVLSVVHPSDNFSKRLGRNIVESRLKQALKQLPNKLSNLDKKRWLEYDF